MTAKRSIVAALALLLCFGVAIAHQGETRQALPVVPQGQRQLTPEQTELAALQREYSTAMNEYQRPLMQARTAEERANVTLDVAKHPGREFYPKFVALADKFGKTDVGFSALSMGLQAAAGAQQAAQAEQLVNRMVRDFGDTPLFQSFLTRLPIIQATGETREQALARTERLLSRIEAEHANAEFKAAAFSRKAGLYADTDKGLQLNRELIAKYPNSAAAERAKGVIFEAENLAIGKVAPDFESEDIDGKKFKLSDYRGKVVVVDFWGFW